MPGNGGSVSDSLEVVHDEIHGYIGSQMGDPTVARGFCVPIPVVRVFLTLVYLQDLTLFSSCITGTSIVYTLFGQRFTLECGSHVDLLKVEPSLFPELQPLTTTPVCFIAFNPACLYRFLTRSRPYAFLGLTEWVLGFIRNYD